MERAIPLRPIAAKIQAKGNRQSDMGQSDMDCYAPSEEVSSTEASSFGNIAEDIIAGKYLEFRGTMGAGFYSVMRPTEDFHDQNPKGSINRKTLYISYLVWHNANNKVFALKIQNLLQNAPADTSIAAWKNFLLTNLHLLVYDIPDLVTHSPMQAHGGVGTIITEFYEIKPNSNDGRGEGYGKVARVSVTNGSLGLPYTPGWRWAPDQMVPLGKSSMGFAKLYLHYKLLGPGLIVYEVCLEDPLEEFIRDKKALILFIIIALLRALAKRLRIPIRIPESLLEG